MVTTSLPRLTISRLSFGPMKQESLALSTLSLPPNHDAEVASFAAVVFLVGWAVLRVLALIPFVGGWLWFLGSVWGLGLLAVAIRSRPTPVAANAGPLPPVPPTPVPAA